jgi:hypothetical protein
LAEDGYQMIKAAYYGGTKRTKLAPDTTSVKSCLNQPLFTVEARRFLSSPNQVVGSTTHDIVLSLSLPGAA